MAGRIIATIGPDRIGGDEWQLLDAFDAGREISDAFDASERLPTWIGYAWICAHGAGADAAPGPAGIALLAQPQEATKGAGGW
ncbi:hypothetical protein [Frankia sp. CiP3]|uniref:hypothetical protein n=1 Tax=Frankia sp. CiP3 TaxID=2880971 RepID=UPI001EF43AD9|nr:hypothetical protein [Frankia sp. CiP3]